jgi:type II secretory pathway component PulC
LKILVTKAFFSRSRQKLFKKGEVVEGSEAWAKKIESQGLGIIQQEAKRPYRKKTTINKKEIETTAIEPPNE